jgi:hypothetical protein
MSAKILAALTAVAILVSAGAASAKSKVSTMRHNHFTASQCDPYAGTVWDGVAPYGSSGRQCDPYAGTVWDDVAPY